MELERKRQAEPFGIRNGWCIDHPQNCGKNIACHQPDQDCGIFGQSLSKALEQDDNGQHEERHAEILQGAVTSGACPACKIIHADPQQVDPDGDQGTAYDQGREKAADIFVEEAHKYFYQASRHAATQDSSDPACCPDGGGGGDEGKRGPHYDGKLCSHLIILSKFQWV